MNASNDVNAKQKFVKLTKIISRQSPADVFEDIHNVYKDSMDINNDISVIVETMLLFV